MTTFWHTKTTPMPQPINPDVNIVGRLLDQTAREWFGRCGAVISFRKLLPHVFGVAAFHPTNLNVPVVLFGPPLLLARVALIVFGIVSRPLGISARTIRPLPGRLRSELGPVRSSKAGAMKLRMRFRSQGSECTHKDALPATLPAMLCAEVAQTELRRDLWHWGK